MEFIAGDVRGGWLPFRCRGGGTRVEGRRWMSHESRDWRGLRRALEVIDEHSYGSADGLGYGCFVA
jgi:hypothetical protein